MSLGKVIRAGFFLGVFTLITASAWSQSNLIPKPNSVGTGAKIIQLELTGFGDLNFGRTLQQIYSVDQDLETASDFTGTFLNGSAIVDGIRYQITLRFSGTPPELYFIRLVPDEKNKVIETEWKALTNKYGLPETCQTSLGRYFVWTFQNYGQIEMDADGSTEGYLFYTVDLAHQTKSGF